MWNDDLGAGVQMALFDVVGKTENVPVYRLLDTKVRDWCPIAWWTIDMPPEQWAEECRQAVDAGYTSAKLKARPWFDLHAGIQSIQKVVPQHFKLDLDYNATLGNSANAIHHLKELEEYHLVGMIESPIPQGDVAGNRQIRNRVNLPIVMHYGDPSIMTALREDVTDGFVLSAGASRLLRQAAICEETNKPFWLQLVGTGITTTWAAHLGAVLPQAQWPAITCMNIRENQLIKPGIEVRSGFHRVPEGPGLGIQVDEAVVERYRVDYSTCVAPRHLYRYVRASGEATYYACSRQELHDIYVQDAQPISERGSRLEIIPDDGSKSFARLYTAAKKAPVRK
jgi:L-alanine-DL-glutamate epimerase-like enolase superfamily enzyme